MKLLIIFPGLLFSFLNFSYSQDVEKDLSVFLDKDIFNKVLSKAVYPFVLIDKHNPGPPEGFNYSDTNVVQIDETGDPLFLYTEDEAIEIFRWAVDGVITKNATGDEIEVGGNTLAENDDVSLSITQSWNSFRKEAKEVLTSYEEFKDAKNQKIISDSEQWHWPENLDSNSLATIAYGTFQEGYNQLNQNDSKRFKAGAKLSYLKIQILSQPNIQFMSPISSIADLEVNVTATGELWVKRPKFQCIKSCTVGPIEYCCRRKKSWIWERIDSVTLSRVILTEARIKFFVSDNEKIMAEGEFTKLRLDHSIFRKIELKGIANKYIKDKKLEVFDVRKWLIDVPIIGANVGIEKISLPQNEKGVEVVIDIK